MRDPKAALHGSVLLGSIAVVTLPVALIAGRHSDRHGPKDIVWISGWSMAGTAAVYMIDCFAPSWPFTIVIGLIFRSCKRRLSGSRLDARTDAVLPKTEEAGKDMGIWHVSFVLPRAQAIALSPLRSPAGPHVKTVSADRLPRAYLRDDSSLVCARHGADPNSPVPMSDIRMSGIGTLKVAGDGKRLYGTGQ